MKMHKLSRIRSNVQAGFTLIELIVVIVILGILAATALPRFADLGGDARISTVRAAGGALQSTVAMARGRFLINPADNAAAVNIDGVAVVVGNGYPVAGAGLVEAAGLLGDEWTALPASAGTATSPVVTAGTDMVIVPTAIVGTAATLTCHVRYTNTTTTQGVPPTPVPPAIDVQVDAC